MLFQRLQKRQRLLFPAALIIGVITSVTVGYLFLKNEEEEALANYRVAASLYLSDMAVRLEGRAQALTDMVKFYDQAPAIALQSYQALFSSQGVFDNPDVMVHVLIEESMPFDGRSARHRHQDLYDIEFRPVSKPAIVGESSDDGDDLSTDADVYLIGTAWPQEGGAEPPAKLKQLWDNVQYGALRRVTNHAHASPATKLVFTDDLGRTQKPDSGDMLVHTVTPMTLRNGDRVALVQSIPLRSVLPSIQNQYGQVVDVISLEPLSIDTITSPALQTITFDANGRASAFSGPWTEVQTMSMFNRDWTVKILAESKLLSISAWPAILITTLGIAVTMIMSFGMWVEFRNTARVSDVVARRTSALKDAQEEQVRQNQLLRKLNEDLTSATEAAETANLAKSEFLATMSHELRTPLNAILGFSQILREETLGPIGDARYIEYAKDINQSGEHLLSVINDILDLAKLEAGRIAMETSPVSVYAFVERVIALHQHLADGKGLALKFEIDDALPDVIYGDELRLRQILINLVTNAIKFTETGDVCVRAYPKAFPVGTPGWVLEVSDTGIGIEENQKALLFERFAQADTTLSRKHGGVGLGLAICSELVRKMDGSIVCESEAGKGTMFRVQLPLDEVKAGYDDGDLI